jgi:hypothetical protein
VVLFVGRHEERKGLSVLLDAVASLPDDVVVWVAGEGPQTAGLRARHAGDQRIEWIGRIPDAERDARMAAADVFCAPSIRGESFGVILLEAMAAGAPVVASGISGYTQVAGALDGDDEVAALLPPPGDHAARLIEACGLKGFAIGGARVSEKHANFIVNPGGGATADDIERVIAHVRQVVAARTGIGLEPEVRIVGAGPGNTTQHEAT